MWRQVEGITYYRPFMPGREGVRVLSSDELYSISAQVPIGGGLG